MFEKENKAYADPNDPFVWLMYGALYGRRNAGSCFKDFQDAVMTEHAAHIFITSMMEKLADQRMSERPCSATWPTTCF